MKRSLLRVVVLSTGIAGMLLAIAVPAGAHGHGHGNGHGHGHGHGAIVVKPGESIQAAVDAAAPGSTIYVKRGTYAENVAITTDGIRLLSRGAKIVPPASPAPNACSGARPAEDGICAVGDISLPDPEGFPVVNAPIKNVTVSGFNVSGFPASGIFFLGVDNSVIERNVTNDDAEYGIARFSSSGGEIVGNKASGAEEAGIYVGDSPNADVLVAGNEAADNGAFGFFFRDAAHGFVVGNRSHGNCIGAGVLNTGGNVAADWRFTRNRVIENNALCPGSEEEGGPSSGIGIAIAGAADNKIYRNYIRDNIPSGEVDIAGGVVVADIGIPGANPPSGNVVKRNLILGNQPDIFWDGSGTGNVFKRNLCETSAPDGLCDSWHSGHRWRGRH